MVAEELPVEDDFHYVGGSPQTPAKGLHPLEPRFWPNGILEFPLGSGKWVRLIEAEFVKAQRRVSIPAR